MKRYSQHVRIFLVSAALGAMAMGCRSSSSTPPETVEARQAAIYSSDPGAVAPGTPVQRTASCPGKTYPDQCGSWEGVELKATAGSGAIQASSDQHCFCRPIAFQVPAKLSVTRGNAGAGVASLTFRKAGKNLQTCVYHGNAAIGRSGKQTGGDAYMLVNCTDQAKAGGVETADWFSLQVLVGDPTKGPTEVSLRLGEADVVGGVVQEEILYSGDARIPGAALHIPRGSAPANQAFSISVLSPPTVGTSIPNGDAPVVTTGYAVDVHATGVAQFAFADVPGAACPRIDLPYSPAAAGVGGEALLRARQITNLAGLTSGATVLAKTSAATIDPVNHIVSFCVSHLSYYVTVKLPFDSTLCGAFLTASPTRTCASAAACQSGEVCACGAPVGCYPDGGAGGGADAGTCTCYRDLLDGGTPPPLLPESPYVLHLDFNNNGKNAWTTANVRLYAVDPASGITAPPWGADVPKSLPSPVTVGQNASFNVSVTSPKTVTDGILDLCLANATSPFGECFSWDPPHSQTSNGTGRASLREVCDNADNDGNGETDDVNGNVATEPGKPCNNGQSGSCLRTGAYQCDGLFATKCNAPNPPKNDCGGCLGLSAKPNTACDTGQTGPCAAPGLIKCNGPDAVGCEPQPVTGIVSCSVGTGLGACATAGGMDCAANPRTCVAPAGASSQVSCDVDPGNGFPIGTGACAGAGKVNCSGTCIAPPGIPAAVLHTEAAHTPNGDTYDWNCNGQEDHETTTICHKPVRLPDSPDGWCTYLFPLDLTTDLSEPTCPIFDCPCVANGVPGCGQPSAHSVLHCNPADPFCISLSCAEASPDKEGCM